jgi:hypothetical protein
MANDNWIQSATRNKGSLTRAAKRRGKSVAEEAKSEAKSPDKKIAARGRLALRFKGLAGKGKNIPKPKSQRKAATRKRS